MKQRWTALRNGMLAAVFLASMGFGAVQATAGDGIEKEAACSAWACQQECAPFGGELGPGGPGQPLICYCCG
ncbi:MULTISPECIES: hypothetical protein [Xanthomonas]|uniref:hypothetical protein n=1 Tax=Xanthomonas TaxID=338 RepID=UPI001619DE7A|nr:MULTISPECIES: hypothetical protein [Xanthomonas]MBB6367292.1 hypothetical protein [Xanthomonas sp. F10]MCI2246900.1 hypothetical protein [Xanthomonas indica]UYC12738.1 hypothetical protein NUG21_03060 [Xanthomonas sp. CFBP 8445]